MFRQLSKCRYDHFPHKEILPVFENSGDIIHLIFALKDDMRGEGRSLPSPTHNTSRGGKGGGGGWKRAGRLCKDLFSNHISEVGILAKCASQK